MLHSTVYVCCVDTAGKTRGSSCHHVDLPVIQPGLYFGMVFMDGDVVEPNPNIQATLFRPAFVS